MYLHLRGFKESSRIVLSLSLSIRMGIITQRYRLLCASSVAHSLFVRSLMKRKMIANGHRTPDNLLLETERNNVQQVFILTRNRPLNGVQTRVYFLLKQGVLTGVWVYKYSAFPNYWSGFAVHWNGNIEQ